MFLKFIFFGFLFYCFNEVQGVVSPKFSTINKHCNYSNKFFFKYATKSRLIAAQHLFMGDVIEISILNLKVVNSDEMKPPLMVN